MLACRSDCVDDVGQAGVLEVCDCTCISVAKDESTSRLLPMMLLLGDSVAVVVVIYAVSCLNQHFRISNNQLYPFATKLVEVHEASTDVISTRASTCLTKTVRRKSRSYDDT